MISAYQSALSGLRAFGTKFQVTSNNIANTNTESFRSSSVILDNVEPHGVKATVLQSTSHGPSVYEETGNGPEVIELSNVNLANELPTMTMNSQFYKANLKTIETVNEMTGELLDIKS
jgi:flagellar hook protein FlgE